MKKVDFEAAETARARAEARDDARTMNLISQLYRDTLWIAQHETAEKPRGQSAEPSA